ncbi:hypothetical protein [Kitasatospora sp. LaBMicrA B282]
MYDTREELHEIELGVFGLVPLRAAPTLHLAGADEEEDDAIVRGID